MSDFLGHLDVIDLKYFLTEGNPSVGLQLLLVNACLMTVYILRRASKPMSSLRGICQSLLWILLFGNFAILCEDLWLPYADTERLIMIGRML